MQAPHGTTHGGAPCMEERKDGVRADTPVSGRTLGIDQNI